VGDAYGSELGLKRGRVRLAADEAGAWPAAFEALAAPLRRGLGQDAASLEHVGSTAVPGLVAKPIVDIACLLAAGVEVPVVASRLATLGWIDRGDKRGEGGWLLVLADAPDHRVAHLHLLPAGDAQWERYLRVRERLRGDPAARAAYGELKRRLAERHPGDRAAYTAGKAAFLSQLLDGSAAAG
jgi:GrpB-like predicted nucleotidyltransferase (UPF0157 family)